MKIYKAYKFRMYPNNEIKSKLNLFMGTSRFIYNYYLEKKDKYYNELGINYSIKDMKKDVKYLNNNYEWLKEVDSCLLRTTIDDLDRSYTNFFEKRSSHPRYKSKNNHDTYRTTAIRSSYKGNEYCNIKVDLKRRIIKLPKLPEIEIRGYRNLKIFEDKKIIQVNKQYASSQICNHCGSRNKEVKDLSIREWECRNCCNKNDRDINASLNIEYEGIIKYYKEQYVM